MVNCRYQVTLKDAVDGALLQQALDAARAKAPYYFQKPVWEKKLLHLEPSDAPCPVRQGSAKPEFPDENGFTVALSYEGKVVCFDWFHFLADGRGIAPFMTMVLQFYCNLRYGTAFEGQTLETDSAYDIEDILAKYDCHFHCVIPHRELKDASEVYDAFRWMMYGRNHLSNAN